MILNPCKEIAWMHGMLWFTTRVNELLWSSLSLSLPFSYRFHEDSFKLLTKLLVFCLLPILRYYRNTPNVSTYFRAVLIAILKEVSN